MFVDLREQLWFRDFNVMSTAQGYTLRNYVCVCVYCVHIQLGS